MLSSLRELWLALDDSEEDQAARDARGDYTPREPPSFAWFLFGIWIVPFLAGLALGWSIRGLFV